MRTRCLESSRDEPGRYPFVDSHDVDLPLSELSPSGLSSDGGQEYVYLRFLSLFSKASTPD
ncbi:hypothetical protein ABIA39_004146 [Nocardia sp. GAS34]